MNKMKRGLPMLIALLVGLLPSVWAYDFSAIVPSGQTLYFTYEGTGVKVVYPATTSTPIQGWVGYAKPAGALTIPPTVQHGDISYAVVAIDNLAFSLCYDLISVEVGEGVRSVRLDAFYQCTSLTSLTLPSSVDSIGMAILTDCAAFRQLTMRRTQPPVVHVSAFARAPIGSATLQVPCGGENAYATGEPWTLFDTVVASGCNYTLSLQPNYAQRGSVSGGGTYAMGSLVWFVAMPSSGHFFACWSDGDTTNPRAISIEHDIALTAYFFAALHDTVVVRDTATTMDTVRIKDTVWLTDTVVRIDTVPPQRWQLTVASGNMARGIGVGSALVAAGTEIEIAGLPLEGSRFTGWSDGNTLNPRRVRVEGDKVLLALFDEDNTATPQAEVIRWTVHAVRLGLEVDAPREVAIRVYDIEGRLVAEQTSGGGMTNVAVPTAGIYVVAVGEGTGRKVYVSN